MAFRWDRAWRHHPPPRWPRKPAVSYRKRTIVKSGRCGLASATTPSILFARLRCRYAPNDYMTPTENPSATSVHPAPPVTRLLSRVDSPIVAVLVILVGILLRLRRYLMDRGVLHDEAQLAFNLFAKTYGQLFRPLDMGDQAAPVGFLLLQKTATVIFGKGELAIRLVPLLAAIAALPMAYVLFRRIAGPLAALIGVAMLALSEPLIHYAAEGKQYSTDAFFTLVILTLALRPLTKKRIILLTVVGAIVIWFSHPALFVLAGAFGAILIDAMIRKNASDMLAAAVGGAAALLSFAINYLLISGKYAASEYLTNYWLEHQAFAPLRLTHSTALLWYPRAIMRAFESPMGIAPDKGAAHAAAWIAAAACVVGCALLARKDRKSFFAIVGTIVLALIASALHKYPFAQRLLLFAAPLLALPAAVALGGKSTEIRPAALFVRLALASLLLVYPAYLAAKYALHEPVTYHVDYDIKPAMRLLHSRALPGDVIYLHNESNAIGTFYWNTQPGYAVPGVELVVGHYNDDAPRRAALYQSDIESLRGLPRVWFVFSMGKEEAHTMQPMLDARGKQLEHHIFPGSEAFLYDLRPR